MAEDPAIGRLSLAVTEALLRLAKTIAGFTTLNDLLRQLPASLREAVPFDHLGLVPYDRNRDILRVALVHPDVPLPMREVPLDFGPAGVVLRTQRTMIVRLDTGEPLTGMMPVLRDLGFRIICGVPLTTPRAEIGVLVFGSCNDASYD